MKTLSRFMEKLRNLVSRKFSRKQDTMMYALHWKKTPSGWQTYWYAIGTNNRTYAFAASKQELDLKLATIGYELGCIDSDGTDDSFDVWNVRKFPGNSPGKDRRQC